MSEEKKVSQFMEGLCLSFPKNPRTYVHIKNEGRTYEFLGMFKLENGFATPYTLGQRSRMYQTMTDVQCVEFLDKYANKYWRGDEKNPAPYPYAELASYPVLMSIVAKEDMFKELRGNEFLTRTVITRNNEKTTMGVEPIIKDNTVFLSENEINIEEDEEGWSGYSGRSLDPSYWSISDWKVKTSNSIHSEIPVCFHNPLKNSKIEKSIPRVLLSEDDTIHVFSDSPLSRTSYITKFPMVRRLGPIIK